jgi:hypothetical protein
LIQSANGVEEKLEEEKLSIWAYEDWGMGQCCRIS